MYCRECGEKNEDNAKFCQNCGTPLDEEEIFAFEEESPAPEKKKNPLILVLIVLIVIAVIVLGIKVLLGDKEEDKEDKTADKKQEQVQDTEEEKEEEKEDTQESAEAEEQVQKEETQAPVTMSLSSKPASFQPYFKIPVTSATATSVIDQDGYDNSAAMVTDEKDETSWQEGVDGGGIGEGLTLYLDREYKIKYMSFKLGNWREKKYYDGNNRPKTLKITAGNCTSSITFPDGQEEYWVTFSDECPASSVEAVIEEIYSGNGQWDDTCIAEISIYGKEE